jgi:alpha-tubulin suppressor-like RCC1 family protein
VGITTSGDAYGWGDNGFFQLGNSNYWERFATPMQITGDHTWASLAAGFDYTVGITTSGDAYAWGSNAEGQLGDGTTTGRGKARLTPTLVSGGHKWASISAGLKHTVGITTSGDAYAWGYNWDGQLGDGTWTQRLTPTLVSGDHKWASISAGHWHTVGITQSGDAYAWGFNDDGQLGDSTTTQRLTPTLVSGSHTWASIATGDYYTVGMTTSGVGYAWGHNGKFDYAPGSMNHGSCRLGDGTRTWRATPTLVSGSHTWASIATGDDHTGGITTSGDAYAWGWNGNGRLGDGTAGFTRESCTPRLITTRPWG